MGIKLFYEVRIYLPSNLAHNQLVYSFIGHKVTASKTEGMKHMFASGKFEMTLIFYLIWILDHFRYFRTKFPGESSSLGRHGELKNVHIDCHYNN